MKENKKLIIILIIAGIAVFFGILFLNYLVKTGVFTEDIKKNNVLNDRVIFEQPKLSIFDETRYINQFPDTIHIHYPYLIVVVPEDKKKITTVYNLEEKKEITSMNDIVLDYFDGKFLYNLHGGNTYYRDKDLGVHCDQGFIKNEKEILCIVPKNTDPMDNKLVSIDPQRLNKEDVYTSQNAITAVYFDKNSLYVGEYNYAQQKAYLTVNNKTVDAKDLINIIYPMNDKFYAASFKGLQNNKTEAFYEITNVNNVTKINLKAKGEIIFKDN